MYDYKSFSGLSELIDFLNRFNIKKEDIIQIITQDSKYYSFILVYKR